MALVPQLLDDWTLPAIRELLRDGSLESREFEFKQLLPTSKDESGKQRLRRTIAAFANSGGGFLVLGIRDDRALPVDERLLGIDPTVEPQIDFANHAARCTFAVKWRMRRNPIALASGALIHVFEIPESRTKPHGIMQDDRWMFPFRSDGGNEYLSYQQVRDLFRDQRAYAMNLRTIRSEAERMRRHSEAVLVAANNYYVAQTIYTMFRPGALEAAFLQVVGDLADNTAFVNAVNELRGNASAADLEASRMIAQGTPPSRILEPLVRGAGSACSTVIWLIDQLLDGEA